MIKRRDGRWFRDPGREQERRAETEHFYGAGFVSHGLRENLKGQPRRYEERQYPKHYDPGHRRR
jgi:hypothetical protein